MAKKVKSKAAIVTAYMQQCNHPMLDVIEALRVIIINAHPLIEEAIAWNAPTYFYTGNMGAFLPKEHKNYIIGFVLNQQHCVRLIFLTGAHLQNDAGLLEGDFKDTRKLISFYNMQDVETKKNVLQQLILEWISKVS
jgi:hypothetical protein